MPIFNCRKRTCSKIEPLLSEYLDGRLSPALKEQVEGHLEQCQLCCAGLASLRATVGVLRQVPELVPGRSLSLAAPRPQLRWNPYPVLRAATAGVLVFLLIAFAVDVSGVLSSPVTELTQESSESEPGSVRSEDGGLGVYSQEEGPSGEEPDPSAGSGEQESDEPEVGAISSEGAAGCFPALEYGLLGLLVIIGGFTLSQRRQWKRYGCR